LVRGALFLNASSGAVWTVSHFFAVAFAGIFILTLAYVSLPLLYYANIWSGSNWPTAIATGTPYCFVAGALVLMRGKQNSRRDWFWALPVTFVLCALNWLAPDLFSLAMFTCIHWLRSGFLIDI